MAVAKPAGPLKRLRQALTRSGRNGSSSEPRVRAMLTRWGKRGRRWETKPYYPAILDLTVRTGIVVGAGAVGEGKIRGLLHAGARVRVVSPEATEQVRRWAEEGRVELAFRRYESGER